MAIKEFAYLAQQHLQDNTANEFKRSHIYEFFAASFGYNSYAALCSDSIVTQGKVEANHITQNVSVIRQRCIELGYPPATADLVSSALPVLLIENQLTIIKLSKLVTSLRHRFSYIDDYSDWENDNDLEDNPYGNWLDVEEDEEFSTILLAELETAANKGNVLAHYALALIHTPDDEFNNQVGIDYWYNQEKQGRVLTGVEKEWADQFAKILVNNEKYGHHLREAARLGNEHALLDMAEKFDDPSFFEQAKNNIGHNPLRVASIAENLGRVNDTKHWLTITAESGDIESMRRLIEEFDQDDLLRCWTWIYLAQLLETDLTQDNYHGINEDGSPYDDDVGGPIYLSGREGVKIETLDTNQDQVARLKAQALFAKMQ